MTYVKLFFTILPIAVVLDLIFIGVFASGFYRSQTGTLMMDHVNWVPAILFYLVFSISLIVFVIHPALAQHSLTTALLLGALFGFTIYMTYDFTNLATLKDWPVFMSIVDMLWGTIFATLVSGATYVLATKFWGM